MSPNTLPQNEPIAQLNFEQAYAALAQIVRQLEAGSLSLSDSLTLFEHGQALARHCESQLEAAELRISQLNGTPLDLAD